MSDPTLCNEQNLNEYDEEDEKIVKVLNLGIGEVNPTTTSLIAMEMSDSKKTGYKSSKNHAQRKKSIDRIFEKMNLVDISNDVDKRPLKTIPRRSLISFDPSIMNTRLESDDEEQ